MTVRTRFCPAPSGWLHVGGARTALYNWLYARHHDGRFVVRIEDTDADRVTRESVEGMLAALRFLGLDWDEGPEVGGPCGPYVQSERGDVYRAFADALVRAGHAYEAFETADELRLEREAAQREGRSPGYSGAHRDLGDKQRAAFRAEGRVPVIRMRTPDEGSVSFTDLVRGEVEVAWKDVFDFVLLRADGSPTYYLANTVDDAAQGITLVARGEDLLSATFRQLVLREKLMEGGLLDKALADVGYPPRPDATDEPPRYAHLPLLVGADRKPLSKRHGSVAVDEFRRQGLLPEVLVNFLALCGWSHDGVRERFTVPELVELFSLERVGRNPAFFDTDKLRVLNGDRIRELAAEEFAERLVPYFVEAGVVDDPPSPEHRALIDGFAPLLQPRSQTLADAVPLVAWAFRDEVTFDEAAARKHLKGRAGEALDRAAEMLAAVAWDPAVIEAEFRDIAEELSLGLGKVMQPVRVAVTGTHVSPPLPETLAVLDRDLVVQRVRDARGLVAG